MRRREENAFQSMFNRVLCRIKNDIQKQNDVSFVILERFVYEFSFYNALVYKVNYFSN